MKTTPPTMNDFELFCNDADAKTPARAAAELRRYGVPDEIVDKLVDEYERHVGVVREVTRHLTTCRAAGA